MRVPCAQSSLGSHRERQAAHAQTRVATIALIAEFAELPPDTVKACVARAREDLLGVGLRSGLAEAIVSMSRHRLQTVAPARVN